MLSLNVMQFEGVQLRKYIIVCTIVYFIFSAYIIIHINFSTTYTSLPSSQDVQILSRISGKDIEIHRFGKWEKTYLKGVDIGAAKPGAFPGNFAITKSEYLRWFKQIAEMNANTIRVYTILSPEFYDAFKTYNETHLKKLYLIQSVWVNEEATLNTRDAFSPVILDEFQKDTMQAIDVIHGNVEIEPVRGKASGVYTEDVSKWVIGYILGIEWDGDFVKNTNMLHPEYDHYRGVYLRTENAEPFESFLAQIGDAAIAYETKMYKQQRMIAFSNWPTTDPLSHSNEEESVNLADVDTERIKATDQFYSGQFASYHVYPYYPDFLEFQKEYQKPYPDGGRSPYQAYLEALIEHHSMPVVISEYGVPSSRGIARKQSANGYDQGNLTEKEQGEILIDLTKIIHDTGCAGGLIFSWQDEWFKRTWNTMDYSLPDYRPYWSDYQTNEQSFGLLTFDPGRRKSVCYVDGNTSEWDQEDILIQSGGATVSVKSDEKFLYFMVHQPNLDLEQDQLMIPIDITQKSGIKKSDKYRATFERQADFLLRIDGKQHTSLLVHDYFDAFTYHYSQMLFHTDPYSLQLKKDEGDFVSIYMALRAPLLVEATGKLSAPSYFNTGRLVYGNANPNAADFNSIADFYAGKDNIEIRIPWGLLNIMDPSSKKVMNDFYSLKGISSQSYENIYIGIAEEGTETVRMLPYDYQSWEEPGYHERRKESYSSVKNVFRDLD